MQGKYSKKIYSKEAIFRAAYSFTDIYYLNIDSDDDYFYIDINNKNGSTEENIGKCFENELITQMTRINISKETKTIRELVLARAFASTIIEDYDKKKIDNVDSSGVFNDWNKQ